MHMLIELREGATIEILGQKLDHFLRLDCDGHSFTLVVFLESDGGAFNDGVVVLLFYRILRLSVAHLQNSVDFYIVFVLRHLLVGLNVRGRLAIKWAHLFMVLIIIAALILVYVRRETLVFKTGQRCRKEQSNIVLLQ